MNGEATLRDMQRRLDFLTRAMWAREIALRAMPGVADPKRLRRTFLAHGNVFLPPAWHADDAGGRSDLYRAAAAHAGAHVAFSTRRFELGRLKPIKIVVMGMLEDARVEALAIRWFPGLRRLWSPLHGATPQDGGTFEGLQLRLARALLDPDYVDDDYWVCKGRRLWAERLDRLEDPAIVGEIANILANDIGQMRLQLNARTFVMQPAYRDDNRHIWDVPPGSEGDLEEDALILAGVSVDPTEAAGQGKMELASGEGEGEGGVVGSIPRDEGGPAVAAGARPGLVALPVQYPEWDYMIGVQRPDWCTVLEREAVEGDPHVVEDILLRHAETRRQLEGLLRAARVRRPVRLRRQREGDRIDLEAAVDATIDLRRHQTPDPRIHMRIEQHGRDLAVLVLLDLSESTNQRLPGGEGSVLDLGRAATVLLCDAMASIGDRFAVHGFASNGRHEVEYTRFKDFGEAFDGSAHARLAGMRGGLSTRMGTAIRHSSACLRKVPADKHLLLVITDGEPSDVDVHDPKYLVQDARRAVDEAVHADVLPFCVSLDPKGDAYVKRIFGIRNFLVVDRIESLPTRLPPLYMRLTHY